VKTAQASVRFSGFAVYLLGNERESFMKLLQKKNIQIILAAALVLILIGTFLDFQISSLVVNQDSLFGKFFLLFGQFPVMLCGFAASAMLWKSLPEEGNEKIIFQVLSAGGILGGLIGVKEVLENASGFLRILCLLLELALGAAMFWFVYRYCDASNPRRLRRTALFILFTVLITTAAVVFVKIPWGRPRYRSIVAVSNLDYQPWYVIGKSARNAFEGVLDHDEFKSFPSGHTASAAYILTLITLKNVIPMLKEQEKALTIAGFVWIVLTAIARIVSGAHFLTDVTFGFLITFLIMWGIGSYLKINRTKKN
jgi:membrane-associated phospholipid phosphatase